MLAELVRSLRDYLEEIEFNPKRLEEVEERLDLIHSLTRKYGGSIEKGDRFRRGCARTTGKYQPCNGTHCRNLKLKRTTLLKKLAEQGGALSQKRQEAAVALGQRHRNRIG